MASTLSRLEKLVANSTNAFLEEVRTIIAQRPAHAWLGYFGRKQDMPYTEAMALTVDALFDALGHDLTDIAVANANWLGHDYMTWQSVNEWPPGQLELINAAVKVGLLRLIDVEREYGGNVSDEQFEQMSKDVRVSEAGLYGEKALRDFLTLKMSFYSPDGKFFIISKSRKLCFYPHDDAGFGVYALAQDADIEFGRTFLRKVGESQGFFLTTKPL